MTTVVPYLRTQTELLSEAKIKTRLKNTARWSDDEYYTALNECLMTWGEAVRFPSIYPITNGWIARDYDYELPSYVREPIFPQLFRNVPFLEYAIESATSSWIDIAGFEVEPSGTGGLILRLYGPPRNKDARILFYTPNSRVPLTIPTLNAGIDSDDTSLVLGSAVDVDDTGFIKIGSAEYAAYTGVTRAAATTTLLNLQRGLNGMIPASHLSGVQVQWCVGADDMRLWKLLFDQWRSYMNAYFIQDGGVHETERHEKSMGYYDQQALNFWPTYKPQRRRPGLRLNQKVFLLR